MPTYDFKCRKCNKKFTTTVRIAELKRVKCPKCKTGSPDRVWESFTVLTKKKT